MEVVFALSPVQAIEAIDRALARVIPALLQKGGIALITADHGNAELNIDPKTILKTAKKPIKIFGPFLEDLIFI